MNKNTERDSYILSIFGKNILKLIIIYVMKQLLVPAALMLLSLVSCTKEPFNDKKPSNTQFSVIALPPLFETTKASFDASVPGFEWGKDDELSVAVLNNGQSSVHKFKRSTVKNQFLPVDGYVPADGKNEYFITYPYSEDVTGVEDGFLTGSVQIGKEVLTQTGSDNSAHILPSFYGYVSVDGTGNAILNMQNASAIVKIVLHNMVSETMSVKGITMTCDKDIAGDFSIGGTGLPEFKLSGEGSKSVELDVTDVDIALGESATFYLSCAPFTLSQGEKVTFSVETADGTETYEKTAPAAGLSYTSEGINLVTLGSNGGGTQDDPFLLSSPSSLQTMSKFINLTGETYFKLENDIDMSSVTEWTPLNASSSAIIHFDGNGKTIRNFTCSASSNPSFFGTFVGTCRNLTFENAVVNVTDGSSESAGIFSSHMGAEEYETVLENVRIQGTLDASTITIDGYSLGQMGVVSGLTQGKVLADGVTVEAEVYGPQTKEFDLNSKPSVTVKEQNIGGMFGAVAKDITISNSSVSGTIQMHGNVAAGMISKVIEWPQVKITSSFNAATVYGGSSIAGFIGVASSAPVTMEDCYNIGKIKAVLSWGDSNVAGMISQVGHIKMYRSYNEGFIDCIQNSSSGMVGTVWGSAEIENCYVIFPEGNNPSGWETFGGILATTNGTVSIKNCYVSGATITARADGIGGIVGIAKETFTVSNSIADIAEIYKNNEPGNANGESAGAIVGFVETPANATLENCWRCYGMAIKSAEDKYSWMQPYDQENASPASIITWTYDSGTYAAENHKPYHGKAMAEGETVSQRAQKLGWDTSVWDLSSDLPKLVQQ